MQPVKQVIVLRKDLNVRKGRLLAHVARVSMKFLVDNNTSERPDALNVDLSQDEVQWLFYDKRPSKIEVFSCDSEGELRDMVLRAQLADLTVSVIIDKEETETKDEPVMTCAAFGPAPSEEIDRIIRRLTPM